MVALPFSLERPLRIGHMGAAGLAPANSLAAIEAALRAGVDLIEVDVWSTLDHQLVLGHFNWVSPERPRDPMLPLGTLPRARGWVHTARTWRAWPRISQLTLASLRRLPAPPPRLDEALDLMRGRARPYLDLRVSDSAELIAACLRRGAPDGALIGSGPQRSFLREQALLPGLVATSGIGVPLFGRALSPTSLATLARRTMRGARAKGATGLSVEYHLLRPPFVETCHEAGFFVFAWTVDDPAIMRRLIAEGVDGITTNRPDLLADLS